MPTAPPAAALTLLGAAGKGFGEVVVWAILVAKKLRHAVDVRVRHAGLDAELLPPRIDIVFLFVLLWVPQLLIDGESLCCR